MKRTTTATGKAAANLIKSGMEIQAEMEYADLGLEAEGVASKLDQAIDDHGVLTVLAVLHDAARNAAEVHAGSEGTVQEAVLRLNKFCVRLRQAMECLK